MHIEDLSTACLFAGPGAFLQKVAQVVEFRRAGFTEPFAELQRTCH